MIICLVLFLALSSVWGYKIQVRGRVEMGDQVTQLLNELRDTLHQEEANYNVQPMMLTKGGDGIANKRKHPRKHKTRKTRKTRKAPTTLKRTVKAYYDETEQSEGLWPLILRNIPFLELQDESPSQKIKEGMSLLDEMVHDKQEVSHVYGKHVERHKWPLNKIHVRVSDSRRSNKPEIAGSKGSNTTVSHN